MTIKFDAAYYLAQNPDVAAAVARGEMTAQQHWEKYGIAEGRNPNAVFDTDEYLAANPDVAASGMNPLTHFIQYGAAEGRSPSDAYQSVATGFDNALYLNANPDVAAAVQSGALANGYQHWVLYGQFEEGRPEAIFNNGTPVSQAIGNGGPDNVFTLTEIPSQTETTLVVGPNDVPADMALAFLRDVAELDLQALGLVDENGNMISDIASINIEDNTDGTAQITIQTDNDLIDAFFDGQLALFTDVLFSSSLSTVETTTQTGIVLTPSENNGGAFESGFTSAADDHIVAGRTELLHGAYIDGGGGYNTLEVDMKGFFAQPFQLLNIQEVQVQNLSNVYDVGQTILDAADKNFPVSNIDSGTSSNLDLSRAASLEKLVVTEGPNNGTLNIAGIQNYATARLEGNFSEAVNLFYGRGQGDLLTIELANVSFENTFSVNQNVGAVELVSEGRVNTLDAVDFGGNFVELIVSGSGLLSIEDDLNFGFGEAMIDASANTGGVRMAVGTQAGFGALEEITITGSQARDVFDINSAAQSGVLLNIDTGTGRDTIKLNEALSAGEGSVITGETLTVQVNANADLREADVSGVNSFLLAASGGLLLTQAQVEALGAGAFAAAHNAVPVLSIEVSEAGTVLSDLIDLTALDSDVKLAFNVKAGASLELTAEELHTYLADDGVVGEGTVTVTGAGLGFNANDPLSNGIGDGVGSIDNGFEGTLNVIRAADGFERPVAAPGSDVLLIDTTDTGGVFVGANDISDVDAFSTAATTVIIEGSDDITFNVPVEMTSNDFTLDFSGLTGALNNLTIREFDNVEQVIGNGAGVRINVELEGDVGVEGEDSGLISSGVEQYIVTDLGNDDRDFHLCDNTQDVEVIGLQGNAGGTLTFTNIPWGAVNPTILFEGDGYGNWDQLPKAASNPNASNVGTIEAEYFFDGAPANVLITNQGADPGLTSDGEPRPIVVDGISVDNAQSLNITVEDGNAVISDLTDAGSGEGLEDVTLTSAFDVTLNVDSGENSLESIDASGVAGTMTLFVQDGGAVDLSDTTLTDIDAIVMEDTSSLTLTIDQIQDIGAANFSVENDGDSATLNVGNYDGQAFDFSALALDGIDVGTVTTAEGTFTVDPTTDFTGISQLIVPADSDVTISAVQFQQLVDSGATIVTQGTAPDNGSLTVDLDGDLTIGSDDETTINGSNVTFEMANGEVLNVETFSLADELQVTGDAAATTKPLVNFLFDTDPDTQEYGAGPTGIAPDFFGTIDVGAYQDVDVRIQDLLLDNFGLLDNADSSLATSFTNSQSIEDLLEDLASANILNIYQEEVVAPTLDPRDREVVVEPEAEPDGIEFSAEGSLADYVRSVDLTLQASAADAATINGDISVNDGQNIAGFTMLTINAEDVDGAATGPVTINGNIRGDDTPDVAGDAGELTDVVVNADHDIVVNGTLIFNSLINGTDATLTLNGAGDITISALDATDTDIDTLNIVNNATGTVNVPGASPATTLNAGAEASNLVITGTGSEINFGTMDDPSTVENEANAGVNSNDLETIDASGYEGDLNLGIITGTVSNGDSLTVTGSQGVTTLTLGSTLGPIMLAAIGPLDVFAMAAQADVDIDLSGSAAGSVVTLTDGAWLPNMGGEGEADAGSLTISAETLVIEGNVDLTGLVDQDGNNKLDLSNVTTIEVAPDSTLSVTAEQLDALNAAGVVITKQAAVEGETEGVVVVPGITGDLTAANADLDADLDLSQADQLILGGAATLSGEQVSGREVVAGASDVTVTGVTADTDLSGIATTGTLTIQAGETETTLSLSAAVISGLDLTVEGAALATVDVTGVEAVVGAEGEADEGQVNANFTGLVADGLDVVFQLDSTGNVEINGADFAATVGAGSTALNISGTGTVTAEGAELQTVGAIDVGANATLALTNAQHTAVGGNVEGEGTLQVVGLGDAVESVDAGAAADTVDYLFSFSETADLTVTVANFTADSSIALDKLDFTALLGGEQTYSEVTAQFTTVNQTGTADILSFASGLGTVDDVAGLETALAASGAFTTTTSAVNFGFGEERVFLVEDAGGNTDGYHWVDGDEDGLVSAGELTQLTELTGVSVDELISANFAIA
ncbi:beta strand repeat-containing protein [Halomonas sp.]|uniref:beta strand repeat-containing protein n=1 Tax=Halomonas sp. TaxID=1486246 RepID=UPI00384F16B0